MTVGGSSSSSADHALVLAQWQQVVLAPRLRRSDLIQLTNTWPLARAQVQVFRNHPFDFIEQAWAPFLAYTGLLVETHLGGYDDALTLTEVDSAADVCIVSLDLDRVAGTRGPGEVVAWLDQRVGALRRRTNAPVIVTNWVSDDHRAPEVNALVAEVLTVRPGVVVADVASLGRELGREFFDDRALEIRATRWSDAAVLSVARAFGTQWLPALLLPPVKAVVVDLDQTLYSGVLGEDGVEGVVLTAAHDALQRSLLTLSEAGVYVAVSSRNEQQDVDHLFAQRADFPLQRRDVSVVAADWGSKARHVAEIAEQLNISTDAVVFLDDNPGELASVRGRLPGVRTLHAADPETSSRALRYCPGLFRFRVSSEDLLRVGDQKAGAARVSELRGAEDPVDYLRSLEIVLTHRRDDPDDVDRIAELSAKTNQFSTTLRRTAAAELHQRLRRGEVRTVAVTLSDRLSDSGTVASVVARSEGSSLVVEEVTISCRALGRGIEDALLAQALLVVADEDVRELRVEWVEGPRNGPALAWLRRLSGGVLGEGAVPWDPAALRQLVRESPFTLRADGAVHVG